MLQSAEAPSDLFRVLFQQTLHKILPDDSQLSQDIVAAGVAAAEEAYSTRTVVFGSFTNPDSLASASVVRTTAHNLDLNQDWVSTMGTVEDTSLEFFNSSSTIPDLLHQNSEIMHTQMPNEPPNEQNPPPTTSPSASVSQIIENSGPSTLEPSLEITDSFIGPMNEVMFGADDFSDFHHSFDSMFNDSETFWDERPTTETTEAPHIRFAFETGGSLEELLNIENDLPKATASLKTKNDGNKALQQP
jgi:hypothetical protein